MANETQPLDPNTIVLENLITALQREATSGKKHPVHVNVYVWDKDDLNAFYIDGVSIGEFGQIIIEVRNQQTVLAEQRLAVVTADVIKALAGGNELSAQYLADIVNVDKQLLIKAVQGLVVSRQCELCGPSNKMVRLRKAPDPANVSKDICGND